MTGPANAGPTGGRNRPRAILLDLDDTLLDNSGIPESVARTCRALEAAYGLDPQRLHRANSDAWRSYRPTVERESWLGHVDGLAISREAWRRTLQACGSTDEAVVRYALELMQRFTREAHRLFDDAVELLGYLAADDVRVALVTNGPADLQRDKLRVLGIEDSFHAVVISGEHGVAKPDPASFRLALRQLAVEPGDAWHVGDNLVTDVGGARAAGLYSVWLNRRGAAAGDGHARPDLEVASLAEVATLLRSQRPH